MINNELIAEVRSRWRELIAEVTTEAKGKANKEKSYICVQPGCSHGANGDGLTYNPKSHDRNGLKCFSCGWSGDIIDLFMLKYNISFQEAVKLCAERLSLTAESASDCPQTAFSFTGNRNLEKEKKVEQNGAEPLHDYSEYYSLCKARLSEQAPREYLNQRGISLTTAELMGLGFDPTADPVNAPGATTDEKKKFTEARLIIPASKSFYTARALTDSKYCKMNSNEDVEIFNREALWSGKKVFVTEGAFDALSVIECGFQAVALNSTNNAVKLVESLRERRTDATLLIAFDNDKAGEGAAQSLRTALNEIGIRNKIVKVCGLCKDPNEALTEERGRFMDNLKKAAAELPRRRTNSTLNKINNLDQERAQLKKAKTKTGFANLDAVTGGIHPALYVLAGAPGIGKTTFALQLADQLAAAGKYVLFFSLEQSETELITKSLARISFERDSRNALTATAIRYDDLSNEQEKALNQTKEIYANRIGDRVKMVERVMNCNVTAIDSAIENDIYETGEKPVVIIDYLQVIKSDNAGSKERVDDNISDLKRISAKHGVPLLLMCSLNRDGYYKTIDFKALKESGNIEFTADEIWGLQYAIQDSADEEAQKKAVNANKRVSERTIMLKCLKSRSAKLFDIYFSYNSEYDFMKPADPQKNRK